MAYELVIGNKNYSSWSFRPWLAMTVAEIPFAERLVRLNHNAVPNGPSNRDLLDHSPAGKVPVLKADGLIVWDSLAILEFLAEEHPEKQLWPEKAEVRARARSVSAEMHSGFAALRRECPMNMRREVRAIDVSPAASGDVGRISDIWREALDASGGPFLFGAFTIADAMYAPVVNRLRIYDLADDPAVRGYMDTMEALPAWQAWAEAGRAEPWIIEPDEA